MSLSKKLVAIHTKKTTLKDFNTLCKSYINRSLEKEFDKTSLPSTILEIAMKYNTLGDEASRVRGIFGLLPWLIQNGSGEFKKDLEKIPEDYENYVVSLELIQAMSLAIDDWMDGDKKRRGNPTSHVLFGEPNPELGNHITILASIKLLLKAKKLFPHSQDSVTLIEKLELITEGQALDITKGHEIEFFQLFIDILPLQKKLEKAVTQKILVKDQPENMVGLAVEKGVLTQAEADQLSTFEKKKNSLPLQKMSTEERKVRERKIRDQKTAAFFEMAALPINSRKADIETVNYLENKYPEAKIQCIEARERILQRSNSREEAFNNLYKELMKAVGSLYQIFDDIKDKEDDKAHDRLTAVSAHGEDINHEIEVETKKIQSTMKELKALYPESNYIDILEGLIKAIEAKAYEKSERTESPKETFTEQNPLCGTLIRCLGFKKRQNTHLQ